MTGVPAANEPGLDLVPMRGIKALCDPDGLMNPGKVLPLPARAAWGMLTFRSDDERVLP